MKCTNCKCIVPDSCVFCMYCGSPMLPSGATRTVPVQEYRRNVTHYNNVSEMPPRYNADPNYNNYSDYHRNRDYSAYPNGYGNGGYPQDTYNGYMYGNQSRDVYGGYNGYDYRDNYDNRERNTYCGYSGHDCQNGNTSKISKILLLMIAADVLSLILVLIALLLFVL